MHAHYKNLLIVKEFIFANVTNLVNLFSFLVEVRIELFSLQIWVLGLRISTNKFSYFTTSTISKMSPTKILNDDEPLKLVGLEKN